MTAVCGIGRPSGWRNTAVTANQSAMPPTSDAAKVACRYPAQPRGIAEDSDDDEDDRHDHKEPRRTSLHRAEPAHAIGLFANRGRGRTGIGSDRRRRVRAPLVVALGLQ
jgi:hypothetical protein